MKNSMMRLVLLAMFLFAATGCSQPQPSGTTHSIGRPTTTAAKPAVTSSTPAAGGRIGGLITGGTPKLMTHPLQAFENCISCHGTAGSALHLVDETTHACEQCHNVYPEPQWFDHGNSTAADLLPRVNESCIICHKPV